MIKREIGSDFYLSRSETGSQQEAGPLALELSLTDRRYLSSGRQAIRYCLRDLGAVPKRALLPEFTCTSVIQAFLQEDYQLAFYPLDRDLGMTSSQLIEEAQKQAARVLLFHPYFGFDSLEMDQAFPEDLVVIHDASQSFASNLSYPGVDYRMVSIRKWGPFSDGGFCGKWTGPFRDQGQLPDDREVNRLVQEAYALKAAYIEAGQGDKASYLDLYRQALTLLSGREGLYAMDPQARDLYLHYDWEAMGQKRRANYQALLAYPRWSDLGQLIFPKLDREDLVPLYFPFYVGAGRRDQLQAFLIGRDIYAPVIWPCPDYLKMRGVSPQVARLYQEILVLPIDQRYGRQDMERIHQALDDYLEGEVKDLV